MDIEELRLEVFKRTNIGIEKDDPLIAAVAAIAIGQEENDRRAETVFKKLDDAVKGLTRINETHHLKQAALLNDSLTELKQTVAQVTGLQDSLSTAAAKHAQTILSPVTKNQIDVLERLDKKEGRAAEALGQVNNIQATWARNSHLVVLGIVVALLITASCAGYAGFRFGTANTQTNLKSAYQSATSYQHV